MVYVKRPFAGPQQVLRYLSRYTHRIAIGNGRLMELETLGMDEFLWRFCLYILPGGVSKSGTTDC